MGHRPLIILRHPIVEVPSSKRVKLRHRICRNLVISMLFEEVDGAKYFVPRFMPSLSPIGLR